MAYSKDTRIIFTNHAKKRLIDRKISEYEARQALQYPDSTGANQNGATEFRKRISAISITVIALYKENSWVVVSVWRDPPAQGTLDAHHSMLYQAYQKAGFWGKIWIIIREQFGF